MTESLDQEDFGVLITVMGRVVVEAVIAFAAMGRVVVEVVIAFAATGRVAVIAFTAMGRVVAVIAWTDMGEVVVEAAIALRMRDGVILFSLDSDSNWEDWNRSWGRKNETNGSLWKKGLSAVVTRPPMPSRH